MGLVWMGLTEDMCIGKGVQVRQRLGGRRARRTLGSPCWTMGLAVMCSGGGFDVMQAQLYKWL